MIGFLVLALLAVLIVKAFRYIIADARRQSREFAFRRASPELGHSTDELSARGFTWSALDDHQLARYIGDVSPS